MKKELKICRDCGDYSYEGCPITKEDLCMFTFKEIKEATLSDCFKCLEGEVVHW